MREVTVDPPDTALRALSSELDGAWQGPNFFGRRVIDLTLAVGQVFLRPDIHFEDEDAIRGHISEGDSFFIMPTHFKRSETLQMIPIIGKTSLRPLKYETGLTARTGLGRVFPGADLLFRSIGAQIVVRKTDRKHETADERLERRNENMIGMIEAGRRMAQGESWIYWPEGSTRVEAAGKKKRIKRDTHTLLPIHRGFMYALDAMTSEERAKVQLLPIASRYGKFSAVSPTIYVGKPSAFIEGSKEERIQQVAEQLKHCFEQAVRLDELRV